MTERASASTNRISSSSSTGAGPSASMILLRSLSSGSWDAADRSPGGSVTPRNSGRSGSTRPASPSSTSSADLASVAPCLIRAFAPSERGSSGEPGTAYMSRFCSRAKRAVWSEPDAFAASITTTARETPDISLLRRGKSLPRGFHPSGISLIAAPPASSIAASRRPCDRFFDFDAIIPCHFGTFPIIDQTPDAFTTALGAGADKVRSMAPGSSTEI